VPCATPLLALRERVGHAAGPPAAAGDAAEVAVAAAVLAAAAPVGVAAAVVAGPVVAGPADGLEVPQAVANAAMQVNAAPAIARRAVREDAVIASLSFCPGGSASRVTDMTSRGPPRLARSVPGNVSPVLTGTYRELFAAIAGCAAALTGLLFVAISVAPRDNTSGRPEVIRQIRAAASILAFTNALAVSLFGLVPGNNVGYAATSVAVIGILFTAAGTRSIVAAPSARHHLRGQLGLLALLLATFGFELGGGIDLLLNPGDIGAVGLVSYLLVASLIVGIARAWELVGDRETGIVASIAVLTGHDPSQGGGPSGPSAARVRRRLRSWRRRTSDPPDGHVSDADGPTP